MRPIDRPRNGTPELLGSLGTQAHFLGPSVGSKGPSTWLENKATKGAWRTTCAELLGGSSTWEGTSFKQETSNGPWDIGAQIARRGVTLQTNRYTHLLPSSDLAMEGGRKENKEMAGNGNFPLWQLREEH
ncbi:hypothetical protein Pyn_34392 [Prunus yedoensis var. nudiflora]|uniref:Uncharacterized protein n=1 Tax=Prunus yedoensis var. nudiflora TaxID=2094558 RepID=A0A314UDP4_PRUYE|nr:hypothetical protein Pyn_34392 [Prunus yedoensis var. nudiflora]